jgi:hypothetical protein
MGFRVVASSSFDLGAVLDDDGVGGYAGEAGVRANKDKG